MFGNKVKYTVKTHKNAKMVMQTVHFSFIYFDIVHGCTDRNKKLGNGSRNKSINKNQIT